LRLWGGARTYQLRKAEIYKTPHTAPQFSLENGDTTDVLHLRQRAYLEKSSRDRLENGERVKKRAVRWALGTVALGGAAGWLGHTLSADGGVSLSHMPGGQVQHWAEDKGWLRGMDGSNADQHTGGSGAGVDAHPNEGTLPSSGSRGDYYVPKDGGEGISKDFRVERGHGLIKEVQEWAKAHGYKNVSMEDAERAYRVVLAEHGSKGIIDVHDVNMDGVRDSSKLLNDTYNYHGDTRISAPGTANWRTGVEADLDKLFKANAEGHGFSRSTLDTHTDSAADIHSASSSEAHMNEGTAPSVRYGDTVTTADVHPEEGVAPNVRYVDFSGEAHPNEGVLPNERYADSAVERIIAKADASDINMTSQSQRWSEVFDRLRAENVVNIPKDKYASFSRQLWPRIRDMAYTDRYHTPVAFLDRHNTLRMNMSPNGILHPDALRRVVELARLDDYDIAA
jgi:hypothetical protein